MKNFKLFSIVFNVGILFLIIGTSPLSAKNPKNVIFMIGDGMGISQIFAAMVVNNNSLALEKCPICGFSKTYSFDHFTTDSSAGATALACGVKTRNGMIGMNADSVKVPSILEIASRNNLSTGFVVACSVTHATPAAFIAHQVNRDMNEEIAVDIVKSKIDVFIGGGRKYFDARIDDCNLMDSLKHKNFKIATSLEQLKKVKNGKLAGLLYDDQNPPISERGSMLPDGTSIAINIMKNNKKGFFLMVEGSQIDWAGHDSNTKWVVNEVLDFDKAVAKAIDFAQKDKNTLVIITADHETGGMALLDGKFGADSIKAVFATKNHTGVPVPVFAYGPGAENFSGFMENTSFKQKLVKLLNLK